MTHLQLPLLFLPLPLIQNKTRSSNLIVWFVDYIEPGLFRSLVPS